MLLGRWCIKCVFIKDELVYYKKELAYSQFEQVNIESTRWKVRFTQNNWKISWKVKLKRDKTSWKVLSDTEWKES